VSWCASQIPLLEREKLGKDEIGSRKNRVTSQVRKEETTKKTTKRRSKKGYG